jgi:16S rRNA (guanine(1405)-N(7))-methyltransferase
VKSADSEKDLEYLVDQVRQNDHYREIQVDLIRLIGRRELRDRRNLREAVKATRTKLHQVGGAYLQNLPDYAGWMKQLAGLSAGRDDPRLKDFCIQAMRAHASTRERLPILETFFHTVLSDITPIRSVLDLACGLNPLSLSWMPLELSVPYLACDIFEDMVKFLGSFFTHINQKGKVWNCDLSQTIPDDKVHLALLLKSIPCLEQLDRQLSLRLLEGIRAEHLLVSYPVASLGGRGKGMRANYETHFRQLVEGHPWEIKRFEFLGELAFLVTK